jgi:hypothetical protein
MDLVLLINILQFLATAYQISQPNESVVRVLKEVTVEVEIEKPLEGVQFVNKQLQERLERKDALIVSRDIDLLEALFSFKSATKSFNYFGILSDVLKSVVEFCSRNDVFLLRGLGKKGSKVLSMKRTAHVLCTPQVRQRWATWRSDDSRRSAPSTSTVTLFLVQNVQQSHIYGANIQPNDFLPLVGDAQISFNEYFAAGGSDSRSQMVNFYVAKGAEAHWVGFISDYQSGLQISFQIMLKAIDTEAIIDAIRDDIVEYVNDIRKDQEHSVALNETADKFLTALRPPKKETNV